MDLENIPKHVGIIMDGNGRWAQKRGLPRNTGHKKGADVLEIITNHAKKVGVKFITFYAFSTENFTRPQDEVDGIINLMRSYLKKQKKRQPTDVKMNFIGNLLVLPNDIQADIAEMMDRTKGDRAITVNIAFNYGGRQDILQAAKRLAQMFKNNDMPDLDSVSEGDFQQLLYTENQPEVDLLIRTSGEQRISNFLLWQCAYAEFAFPDVLWPDFNAKSFDEQILAYQNRERRLGGVK